ncbi:septum formation family protein [Humibacter ginsenosidimutans]|uniref:Septum formation-related domain-containing protein n=1 Tax=Humibacter ginsenosidimutans TaxID=2599293 RepID=A0A5B8M4L5_9MICO|nr:septum formation family protein [Humibacter ginsenosidimutans]QDZ15273.1 hypothetical protein FPZ11_11340 [Humibacter ginsenosidimutans]
MARFPRNSHEPDDGDDDLSSLFGSAEDDREVDVDDDPDALEPAFPPVASPTPPRPDLPDPRQAPPSWEIPELSMPIPPRPEPGPRGPSTAIPGDGGSFFWGLTPNDEPDPLVAEDDAQESQGASDGEQASRAGSEHGHGHPLVPPTVPLAPYVPPAYDEDAPTVAAPVLPSVPEPSTSAPTVPPLDAPSVPPTTPADAPTVPPATPAVPPTIPAEQPAAPIVPGPPDAGHPERIAVPSWSDPVPPQAVSDTTGSPEWPFAATSAEPAETGQPQEPMTPAASSPAPGTVELPWLRRSRRARQEQIEQAQQSEQTESAWNPQQDASAPGENEASPWGAPGGASVPSPLHDDQSGARPEQAAPPAREPEPAETSSWSLFGDLFDDEKAEPSAAEPSAAESPDVEPTATQAFDTTADAPFAAQRDEPEAGSHSADPAPSAVGDQTTPDIFAAFNAAAPAAGLPGVSASEAAAYDLPHGDEPEPTWPWDAPAQPVTEATTAFGAASAFGAGAAAGAAAGTAAGASVPSDVFGDGTSGAQGSNGSNGVRGRRRSGASDGTRRNGSGAGGGSGGGSGRGGGHGDSGHESDDGGPSPRAQRIMLIVAGALLVVLLLVALFVVGRTVAHPDAPPSPTPTATKTATPTSTPTPTATATGPVAAGKHPWSALRGGECLQPFTTPWADTFTVVDCGTAHAAQMVFTGTFDTNTATAFPGTAQLQTQASALCARAGILNLNAAGQYGDAQMQASYPVTEDQWKKGQRSYYCFVNRSSGQPITGSLMGSGPK